jgi:hypothetical protein
MLRIAASLIVASFFAGFAHAQALEGRLKKIADTKTINIGVRADAMPFSFMMAGGTPEGFMIDLCQRVVRSLASQLRLSELKVSWVLVTVQSRFDVVAKGNADMECGASTLTLGRMKQVDFSSVTFVESTALMVRAAAGMRSISDLAGRKIAVIRGTSNERAVAAQLKRRQLNTALVAVGSGRRRSQRSRPARSMRSPAIDCSWSVPSRRQRTRARWRCFPTSFHRALRHHPAARRFFAAARGQYRSGAGLRERRDRRDLPPLVRPARAAARDHRRGVPPRLDPRVRPCAIRGKAGRGGRRRYRARGRRGASSSSACWCARPASR